MKYLELHERAVELCRQHRRLESEIILILQDIDRLKLFKRLGYSSLFLYAVKALGFSESTAYAFTAVARQAAGIPALQSALIEQHLTVNKASRLLAALDAESSPDLIEFAKCHTSREIDIEVRRRNPKASSKNYIRPISAEAAVLTVTISQRAHAQLLRVRDLLARRGREASLSSAIENCITEFAKRHDPVERANRAVAKVSVRTEKASHGSVLNEPADSIAPSTKKSRHGRKPVGLTVPPARIPLSAEQKHAVHHRDGGRCTHVDENGYRCENERWLHIHHIRPVHLGGGNQPENLTTLCSYHHDLAHQLSYSLEGQVTWLRSSTQY